MSRDERFYAFIVARTSRSRARIRRVSIHKRWLKVSAFALFVVFGAAGYGVYGLVRQALNLRVEAENDRLREENARQRRQLEKLVNRVDAIEDASRRISEMSGVGRRDEGAAGRGAGGPWMNLDETAVAAVEARAAYLEEELKNFEVALSERARVPSIWPVDGEVTDSFGVRSNPFGGGGREFHAGQDISAPRGTNVVAAADGVIQFAGTQSGYGQIVVIDHGNGLTTRYGHLSAIEAAEGREIRRGELLGRVGSTGRSTGPHLHYEVRVGDEAVSPWHYLPAR